MKRSGQARRLTIFLSETARWHRHPVYTEIVHRAHAKGLAGASVMRGIEGFGAGHHLHTSRILSLSEDLPVAIIIVDTADRIDAFLPELDELVTDGLVIADDVDVVSYTSRA